MAGRCIGRAPWATGGSSWTRSWCSIVIVAALAGAVEFMHLFELLTGWLEAPRRRPTAPPAPVRVVPRDEDELVATRLAA